eukprot:gene20782-22810_t
MCNKTVRKNQTSATCFGCKDKFHLRCAIDILEDGCERLYCKDCLPADTETQTQFDDTRPVFDNLNEFLKTRGLKLFHQNLNGLLRKIDHVKFCCKKLTETSIFWVLVRLTCMLTSGQKRFLLMDMCTFEKIVIMDPVGALAAMSDCEKELSKFKLRKIFTRNYAKYNEASFKEDIKSFPWEQVYAERNINMAWNKFKQFLKIAVDKHVPIVERKIRGRECSWLSHDIKLKMKERDYHLKKARRTGKEADWTVYRHFRNAVTRLIRKSKATHTRALFRESINKPKDFWKQLKKCYPVKDSRSQQAKVFKVNNKEISDKKTITNEFCKFFTAIGKNLQSKIPSLSDIVWKAQDHSELYEKMNPSNESFQFTATSPCEVLAVIKRMKRKVSEGYDEIPASLVIDGAEELAVPYHT